MAVENEVTKIFNVRIQTARDDELNATRNNPTLLDGELFYVTGVDGVSGQVGLKIGDGSTPFSQLGYYHDPSKVDVALMGIPNGIATLDANGKVPLSQLPVGFGGGSSSNVIEVIPTQLGKLVYTGEPQMPMFVGYDTSRMSISGVFEATDAGTYEAIFTPIDEYVWSNGEANPVTVQWTIEEMPKAAPQIVVDEFEYSGSEQTITVSNYDAEQLAMYFELSGDVSATNAGDYELIVTAKDNYTILGEGA